MSAEPPTPQIMNPEQIYVLKRRGRKEKVSFQKITARINKLCYGLDMSYIDTIKIAIRVIEGLYPGVTTCELDNLAAETCTALTFLHPDYGVLGGRIFTSRMHKETDKDFSTAMRKLYKHVDPTTKEPMPLISKEFFDNVMANKDVLDAAIIYDKDFDFSFFGMKTLEKAYLLRTHDKVVERPQHMLMRTAVQLHGRDVQAITETYEGMSNKYFIHATPTLFNSGTNRPGLSSCFLLTLDGREDDSIEKIFDLIKDCACISKYSGGIGISIHDVRAKGSLIKSTNGRSEGIIPMLRVFNNAGKYVTQSNKRPGSISVYLEPWHAEILAFLELGEKSGAEELRARDLFYALWIPDLFMEKVKRNEDWCLFCPNEAPGLSQVYGKDFEHLYDHYEKEGRYREKMPAQKLYMKIVEAQMKTGGPYMLYKDAVNRKNNQSHVGTVRSSNLCVAPETKILTSDGYQEIQKLQDRTVKVWNGKQFSETTVRQTSERSELIKVAFSNGSVLECTPYHKFSIQTIRGTSPSKLIVKEAKDLNPDDRLEKVEFPVIRHGQEGFVFRYPYTAGFFSGDGTYSTVNREEKQCGFSKKDGTDFCRRHQTFAGQVSLVDVDMSKCHAIVNHPVPLIALYGDKQELVEYIEKRKPAFKNGPTLVCPLPYDVPPKYMVPLEGDLDTRLRFFEGLCDADGTAGLSEIGTTSIQVSSIHLEFLENVKLMLQTMGVDAKVVKLHNRREELMPDGNGSKRAYQCKESKRLLLTSPQVRHLQSLGFAPKRLALSETVSRKDTKRYIKVVSVEKTGRFDRTFCFNEPLEHKGIFNGILSMNCSEVVQYTSSTEASVCNLASMGLPSYVKKDEDGKPYYDFQLLYEKTKIVTRNLDKVIDITHYPIEKTRTSNMRHRPMGIGVSGLADTFALMRMPFESAEARKLNKEIFETIYYGAVEASCEMAKEKGPYPSYQGSEFSKGKFQFDLWEHPVEHSGRWDWDGLRKKMLEHGMRNSLLTAAMPTASTAQILGFSPCFEPYDSNVYKRETLSGEFPMVNPHLLRDLCELGLWNENVKNQLIENRGSVQNIKEIPQEIKNLYKTVWEISQKVIIDMAADRAVYIDQSQSMNIFMVNPPFGKMTSLHMYAYEKGLKTGMYYLKQTPPSSAIPFTVQQKKAKKAEENKVIEPPKVKTIEEEAPVCTMAKDCISCSC